MPFPLCFILFLLFIQGRVKLFGTVMRSNNVYLAVPYSLGKRAANDQLSVRGTFDRIVAFTEWRWVNKHLHMMHPSRP